MVNVLIAEEVIKIETGKERCINMSKLMNNGESSMQKLNSFERFTKKAVWPAYVGCLLAFMYAVFVRFYEAAGGNIGFSDQLNDPKSFYMASYIAGVIIMLCGFALLTLIKPWGKVIPKWVPLIGGRKVHRLILLIPTLIGTAFLIAHGVSGMITKAMLLAGVITMNFPAFAVVDVDSLAIWDLLFYEPWFVIMGILAGLTASHYAQASGVPLSAFRRCTLIYLSLVFLLTAFFVFAIIFDFGKF
ncbi:DUF3995 domain-containing protein [Bacillus sp. FJAT-53711]|uniref:DUF3995 domain-containing protein n=1 Tax=Bacillus yunxiaonensis TaxID=3127665 RepID=UPI0030134788